MELGAGSNYFFPCRRTLLFCLEFQLPRSRASPKLTISSSTGNIGVSLGGSGIEGSVGLLPGDLVKDAMGQQVLSRSWGHSHIARHLNTAMRSVRRSQTLLDEGGC